LSRPVSENEPQVLAGKPAAISGISLGMSGTAFLDMKVMNERLAVC